MGKRQQVTADANMDEVGSDSESSKSSGGESSADEQDGVPLAKRSVAECPTPQQKGKRSLKPPSSSAAVKKRKVTKTVTKDGVAAEASEAVVASSSAAPAGQVAETGDQDQEQILKQSWPQYLCKWFPNHFIFSDRHVNVTFWCHVLRCAHCEDLFPLWQSAQSEAVGIALLAWCATVLGWLSQRRTRRKVNLTFGLRCPKPRRTVKSRRIETKSPEGGRSFQSSYLKGCGPEFRFWQVASTCTMTSHSQSQARVLIFNGQVEVKDSVELQKTKEYINVKQWIRECKKRWGFRSEKAKAEWKELLADPKIPKAKDQMGWLTMPALHVFASGAQSFQESIV